MIVRLIYIALLCAPILCRAQLDEFNAGFKIGAAPTQIRGDGFTGFDKVGLVAGVFVDRQFSDKWGGLMEMQYIGKGSFDRPDHEIGKYDSYKIDLHYIEMPVLATFRINQFLWEFGPSVGYLFSHSQEDEFGPVRQEDLERFTDMRDFEIALNLGFNMQLGERLYFNARYSHSAYPIADRAQWITGYIGLFGGSYNSVIQLSVGLHLLGQNTSYEGSDRKKSF